MCHWIVYKFNTVAMFLYAGSEEKSWGWLWDCFIWGRRREGSRGSGWMPKGKPELSVRWGHIYPISPIWRAHERAETQSDNITEGDIFWNLSYCSDTLTSVGFHSSHSHCWILDILTLNSGGLDQSLSHWDKSWYMHMVLWLCQLGFGGTRFYEIGYPVSGYLYPFHGAF